MNINYRKRKLTQEEKLKIATDYNEGISLDEITKRYGISKSTIYNILKSVVNDSYYEDAKVLIH